MRLHVIHTGFLKLDGGAMFGIVPRQIWEKLNPPDPQNRCTWALRCLLIETEERKILVDTGVGDKQDEKFRRHFEPHGDDNLLQSLAQLQLRPEDITDVFLTHLHFDHCGGAVRRSTEGQLVPTFPRANYWTNAAHYQWALQPNPREKASFLKENFVPLDDQGQLRFLPTLGAEWNSWVDGISYRLVYGHTEAMMLLRIPLNAGYLIYCADLLPSSYHLGQPYLMAYDLRPLETLREKEVLLEETLAEGHVLFFEHDPQLECARIARNERGRIVIAERLQLSDLAT
ncbi:MAG: MBL fold metallo-hydrolase [Bacteroidota bacterium]